MSTSMTIDKPDPNQQGAPASDLAVLNPVDRVSEMLFGLLMALTFIGAVSAAESGNEQIRTLFTTALGCNRPGGSSTRSCTWCERSPSEDG